MTNKTTLRIPTRDQYAFVELVLEDVTPQEAKEYYDNWKESFLNEETSLPAKDFSLFIDCYISTGHPPEGGLQLWEEMDKNQKVVVNEIKKYFSRKNK